MDRLLVPSPETPLATGHHLPEPTRIHRLTDGLQKGKREDRWTEHRDLRAQDAYDDHRGSRAAGAHRRQPPSQPHAPKGQGPEETGAR